MVEILRLAAFADDPAGGNPAGVVLDAHGLDDAAMQLIAADVGFAETAFVTGREDARFAIRYFSPIAEVPFCGHATIATAIALVEQGIVDVGELAFETSAGPVIIETTRIGERIRAGFTSVEPRIAPMSDAMRDELLALIGITSNDLDPSAPAAIVYAGNEHPLLVISDGAVFDSFTFDPRSARELMDAHGWPATIIVLHAPSIDQIRARNIFPVGTITEDPPTGSAAAAVGAYLRSRALVTPPTTFTIRQGDHVGRPSQLTVNVPPTGGITVSGMAVDLGQ